MEPYWDLIKRIITESDLVLEILDARLVELSRNEEVEKLIEDIGRPVLFVVNKSDLVSRKSLKFQVKKLREKGEVVFVSSKRSRDARILLYAIKKVFRKYGKRKKDFSQNFLSSIKTKSGKYIREAKGEIIVGVLGYPNVGKSSIINALAHKKKVKVSKKAGATHGIHWVKATNEIKLIDSPGVIPLKKNAENTSSINLNSKGYVDDEIRYGLIGAKDVKLKNPELVAIALIKLFSKVNKNGFEKFYGVIIGGNVENVLIEIGKKKGAYYQLK